MSGLTIFIMCMVAAMVIGPIMMMQPNQYQRKVAKLRAKAAQMGLRVRLEKLNDDMLTSYEKPWPLPEKLLKQVVPWRLEKKSYLHDIHIAGYWQVSGDLAIKPPLRDQLQTLLSQLPAGVQVVEVTSMGVRCLWNELGGEVALTAIGAWLDSSAFLMTPYLADSALANTDEADISDTDLTKDSESR